MTLRDPEALMAEASTTGTPERARWLLAGFVSRALAGAASVPESEGRILRLAAPVEEESPFRWLRAQHKTPRIYWSGREDGVEIAAVGVADVVEGDVAGGFEALRKRLAVLSPGIPGRARYYGGARFDMSRVSGGEWMRFGAVRFVLPRFELRRSSGRTELACNLLLPQDAGREAEILAEIEGLRPSQRYRECALPAPVFRADRPGREGWRRNVEAALAAFAENHLEKVVLARRAELGFEEAPDPLLLAERLARSTPGCFHFYLEPEEGMAFLGASPERLYRREGRRVTSEAVAGTRPRGASDADDAGLREELLASEKDLSEQRWVRVGIRESLSPLCEGLAVEEAASEMKLSSRRHLVSKVRGTLREGVADADLLEALHPTPAVGGYPKQEALAEIARLEPFDRGWYAGPVGWVGDDSAEFAVGIRSGLACGERLSLFSGAGIVTGSRPEEEWAEIEGKIGDFAGILGLDDADRSL